MEETLEESGMSFPFISSADSSDGSYRARSGQKLARQRRSMPKVARHCLRG